MLSSKYQADVFALNNRCQRPGDAKRIGPSESLVVQPDRAVGTGGPRRGDRAYPAGGDGAPPAAGAPPPPPASHAEGMARLDALAAQEEAAGARARRARATVGGAGWRGGFLGAKGKGRPGPAAPNPALDSTPAAAALMRRGPRARGGLGAAAAPAPESRDAWRRGFLDRQDAPAARVVASASKPTIGAAARPAAAATTRRG